MKTTTLSPGHDHPLYGRRTQQRRFTKRLLIVLVLALSGLLLAQSAPPVAAAEMVTTTPIVVGVAPRQIYNDEATTITIYGAQFAATPSVTLSGCYAGCVTLEDVTCTSRTTITTTIPAQLDAGMYMLTVTNPDGSESLPIGLVVMCRSSQSPGECTFTAAEQ